MEDIQSVKTFVNTCLLLILISPCKFVYAEADPVRNEIYKLFSLTQMEKKINDSVQSVVNLQIQQDPNLEKYRDILTQFIGKHIGWQALREDLAAMYQRDFSLEELQKINEFYITPVGQKVITTLPKLVQQRNQLAMQRLQQNISELQQLIKNKN